MNTSGKIELANITLINQPSKKRMVRVINEADYQNADTARLGFIFGIMDIRLGPAQNAQVFDLLREAIDRYYGTSLDYDMAFDDIISFLNHRLIQLVPYKGLKEKCDLVIGVLKDKKILFCANGQIYAFMISPQAIRRIYPEDEKTLDVGNKIFPYSLNGEITRGHTIYFCNADFNSIVNSHNLGRAIKEARAEEVIADIKNHLFKQDAAQYYNALFICNPSRQEPKEGSKISLETLFEQERKTAERLSPTLLNLQLLTAFAALFGKAVPLIKKAICFAAFMIFNLFMIITNIRGQRKERQTIVNKQIGGVCFKILDLYRSLTALSKIILGGFIVLSVTLTITVAYGLHQQKISRLKASYEEKIQLVEKLYDEADADIVFQDKNTAIKKLKNALSYLREVPAQIQDASYKNLLDKVKDNLYKIQNISEVLSPVLIADFSAEPATLLSPPLYLDGATINILNQSGIISIDTKNQSIAKNSISIKDIGSAVSFYDANKKIIYVFGDGSLQAVSHANLTNSPQSFSPYKNETIRAFSLFNDKLYALTYSDKLFSVWKYNPALSGFGRPSLWITDNLPDNGAALSFAIDGNLYALFSDNQIYKYYRGVKADWSYDALSIADDAVRYKKIITDENHKYIYLLAAKTVSIISKEGEFLAHFSLPTLNDIQDAVIDEPAKTIYLLDGQKIYTFSYRL